MENTENIKNRFKWNKAYTLLTIVGVIVALLAYNLISDPKGHSLVEDYPIVLSADSAAVATDSGVVEMSVEQ
jgi:hypothetical protein